MKLSEFARYEIYHGKEPRYSDIVELARYAHENTPSLADDDDDDECILVDELRSLVTKQIAKAAKKMAGSEECLLLVEEGEEFARDLVSMVLDQVK